MMRQSHADAFGRSVSTKAVYGAPNAALPPTCIWSWGDKQSGETNKTLGHLLTSIEALTLGGD